MRVALADNRRCFIMLFSSEVVHYELTCEGGPEQAIRFLSQRFRGGTDLASCFRAIIERLQNPQWVDADAVVISDFIAQRLPDEVIAQVGSYSESISTVFTRWRCRYTANPASCASSIISGALIPGCVAACCDAGGANRYSSAKRFREPVPAIRRTAPADMVELQQQHRQARLANAAADSLRHLAAQQRSVPLQFEAIFIAGQRQLAFQRRGVNADPH